MFSEPILFTAAVFFLGVLGVGLVLLGPGLGGRSWAASWLCLYAAGLAALLGELLPPLRVLYPVLGTLFAAYLYLGTALYAGRPRPGWFVPVVSAIAVGRGLSEPFLSEAAVQAGGAFLIAVASLASSHLLWRTSRGRPFVLTDALLAASLPLVAISGAAYAYGRIAPGSEPVGLYLWLVVGIFVAGSQLSALIGRLGRRSESRRVLLQALVDSVPIGLASFDADGVQRAHNRALAETLGTEPAALAGESRSRLLERLGGALEVDAPGLERFLDDADERSEEPVELRLGGRRTALASSRRVRGRSGRDLGSVFVLHDISDELALRSRLERARRLETLGGLAGGLAHDFNNKLTAILGNAELLAASIPADDPRRESLEDLQAAADSCAALTRDLLAFAREGAGEVEDVDLAAFVDALVPRLRAPAPEGVVLAVDVPRGLRLRANPTQLDRVLENLVGNARDAVGDVGTIELRARLASGEGASRVELRVRDDGEGMSTEVQERAFDPFFSTKGVAEGTGLGLAIVYGIAHAHGGEVQIESDAGKGTSIVLLWPAA